MELLVFHGGTYRLVTMLQQWWGKNRRIRHNCELLVVTMLRLVSNDGTSSDKYNIGNNCDEIAWGS